MNKVKGEDAGGGSPGGKGFLIEEKKLFQLRRRHLKALIITHGVVALSLCKFGTYKAPCTPYPAR